eukprot:CAMPEP_0197516456 /NCGR_PEP_ID=MMETSP1318-20131121/1336_1 /TAXON_ID=552666 /ORGANISM="Partenskyella glossopodia, Strain RCC365" /LENGTH=193 /DNA_ID=CAMNT_0043065211 /DNA_START=25 /DNA_END=606 /DNA_ORIENTATION=-
MAEEKSKTKADSTYYFFKSTPAEIAKQYQPQRIDPDAAPPTQTARVAVNNSTGSTWNKMGTWEEKDYSKWACSRLKELLVDTECPAFSTGDLKISEVVKAEGMATILFLRGKRRVGFELNLKAKWKGKLDGKSVSGHVCIPSFDSDEWPDDIEIDITADKSDDAHDAARRYMRTARSSVMKQLKIFYDELHKK